MGKPRGLLREPMFAHTSACVVGFRCKTFAGSWGKGAALKIAEDILRRLRVSACESRYRNAFLTPAQPDRLPRKSRFAFFHSLPLLGASQSGRFRGDALPLDRASANVVSFAPEWSLHERSLALAHHHGSGQD